MEQIFELWIVVSIGLGYLLGQILTMLFATIVKSIGLGIVKRRFEKQLKGLIDEAEKVTEQKQ